GVAAELDIGAIDVSKLNLEVVVAELRSIETDILLPLPEIIRPVVECADLCHASSDLFSLKLRDSLFFIRGESFRGVRAGECLGEQFALECETFILASLQAGLYGALD